jgi:integrase
LLGGRRVRDLTPPDVVRFMRDVTAGKTADDVKTGFRGRAIVKGGAGTASRTVGLLGGILSFAVSEGVIPMNPVRGVKRPADNRREIRLTADQYQALGNALEEAAANGENSAAILAIRLLALTGCRRGEIERLRWDEVDLPGRCLRLSDSKEGKSLRPLGRDAAILLEKLPSDGRYVFNGSAPTSHLWGSQRHGPASSAKPRCRGSRRTGFGTPSPQSRPIWDMRSRQLRPCSAIQRGASLAATSTISTVR